MNDLPTTHNLIRSAPQGDGARMAHIAKARENDTAALAAQAKNAEAIDRAAREFEEVFLGEMLKPMFEGVTEPNPVFGGGKGEEIFSGMMVQEYAKTIAARGGIGIADMVKAEMLRIQEATNGNR